MNNNQNEKRLNGILGIDAGGTFTDLAFMSGKDMTLCAKAKTPTNHENLLETIQNGLDLILQQVETSQIRSVNIATTLATNAIVENKLRPVALILIGYDEDIVGPAMTSGEFGTKNVFLVAGGHDTRGNEKEPLDVDAVAAAIEQIRDKVEGVAVSGYFSVRNTEHELTVSRMVKEKMPGVHVTCGHDLATDLNAIKRATTTVLNAGLIPIVMDLLTSVERVCREKGIDAPITIVRGDGSLVGSAWAESHPVEMILSGPAGSACGACFLAKADAMGKSSWVVDVGGTTTDIIRLAPDGKPVILDTGVIVGDHKTLVKAIDIYTFGLGGDSRCRYDIERKLTLGPRRVRPLCVTAVEHPEIMEMMKERLAMSMHGEPLVISGGRGKPTNAFEKRVLDKVANGPLLIEKLLEDEEYQTYYRSELERMESLGLIQFSGFTPTDALHVLGRLDKWNRDASTLGAKLLMQTDVHETPEDVANDVVAGAVKKMSTRIFRKSFSQGGIELAPEGEGQKIIDIALSETQGLGPRIKLELNAALIGVGAPTWAFIDKAGALLNEDAIQPKDADVAGAIGAAVGSFSLHYAVRIVPQRDGTFRCHHPLGVTDYDELEEAVEETRKFMEPWVVDRARKAGAASPQVTCERHDEETWTGTAFQKMLLWTQLSFTVSDAKDIGE